MFICYYNTGLPGPPGVPILTVTNQTTLTLTWTPPWPHPISDYTVTMLNLTSGQQSQWTTCDEYLVVQRGIEGRGQCNELVFTVVAETEIGSSENSSKTTGGFPKGSFNMVVTDVTYQTLFLNQCTFCFYRI